jgi:hypothetical protein
MRRDEPVPSGTVERNALVARPASASHPVPADVIDMLVSELNEIHRGAALDAALRIGELIVNRFYRGDLTAWRRHSTKEASFRKLAARSERDLRISPTGLYRAVALYELVERLDLRHIRHIGVTHLRLVLGLPEEHQRRLIAVAEENSWQSDRLEVETSRVRRTLGKRSGRTALPPIVRTVRNIAQICHQVRTMGPDADDVVSLSPEEIRRAYTALEDAKETLQGLQRLLLGDGELAPPADRPPVAVKGAGPGSA